MRWKDPEAPPVYPVTSSAAWYRRGTLDQTWPGPYLTWAWEQVPFHVLFEVRSEVPFGVPLQVTLQVYPLQVLLKHPFEDPSKSPSKSSLIFWLECDFLPIKTDTHLNYISGQSKGRVSATSDCSKIQVSVFRCDSISTSYPEMSLTFSQKVHQFHLNIKTQQHSLVLSPQSQVLSIDPEPRTDWLFTSKKFINDQIDGLYTTIKKSIN